MRWSRPDTLLVTINGGKVWGGGFFFTPPNPPLKERRASKIPLYFRGGFRGRKNYLKSF